MSHLKSMSKQEDENKLTPYAGRWIARVRGKIVAQGESAEQAELAARQSRSKESPEIEYVPDHKLLADHPLLREIISSVDPDLDIHLVGGAVRDFLLHRETHDLDFIVPKDGIRTAKKVAKALRGDFYVLDKNTDTGRVLLSRGSSSRDILDFSSYRKKRLNDDLSARDFSINALAYNLRTSRLADPVGGVADLKSGIIRACSPAAFIDDPVRLLRALRFAAGLGFSIQRETRKLMKESVSLLSQPSPERIRDELFKILDGPRPSSVLRALEILGGLPFLFPELVPLKNLDQPAPHVLDAWSHTLRAVDHLEGITSLMAMNYRNDMANDLFNGLLALKLGRFRQVYRDHFEKPLATDRTRQALLVFATLFHDTGKPITLKKEGDRIRFLEHEHAGSVIAVGRGIKLRLSNSELDYIKVIIQNHMRLFQHINRYEIEGKIPTRRAVYRFFHDTGDIGVDLCFLALADLRATYENELTQTRWSSALDVVKIFLENWWERREETISPPLLMDGNDLMETFKLKPGPAIGKILEAIKEAQAVGKVHTREDAVRVAEDWLRSHSAGKEG
jgi:tRNA nucleotidyltransferase/poly(A) polymerase